MAKVLASRYRDNGIGVIVCDPILDNWDCDVITPDINEFMDISKKSRNCALFIDESGESIGQHNNECFWLATRARHFGHKSHFITQRANQLSPTVRGQCSELYLFNCSSDDAKVLSNEFNRETLRNANRLRKLQFFKCPRFGGLTRARLEFLSNRKA